MRWVSARPNFTRNELGGLDRYLRKRFSSASFLGDFFGVAEFSTLTSRRGAGWGRIEFEDVFRFIFCCVVRARRNFVCRLAVFTSPFFMASHPVSPAAASGCRSLVDLRERSLDLAEVVFVIAPLREVRELSFSRGIIEDSIPDSRYRNTLQDPEGSKEWRLEHGGRLMDVD